MRNYNPKTSLFLVTNIIISTGSINEEIIAIENPLNIIEAIIEIIATIK